MFTSKQASLLQQTLLASVATKSYSNILYYEKHSMRNKTCMVIAVC